MSQKEKLSYVKVEISYKSSILKRKKVVED